MKAYSFRLPDAAAAAIKSLASTQGRTPSAVVRAALAAYLQPPSPTKRRATKARTD